MAKLTAHEAAIMRMAMHDEQRELQEGMMNTCPDIGAEYPKMLYRKTDEEQREFQTDANAKCGETYLVVNRYDGMLCETMTVESLDEAEAASADGWELTPRAAYGLAEGLASATSAKDDEIAALRAQLAARDEALEAPRRGRPPKVHQGVDELENAL